MRRKWKAWSGWGCSRRRRWMGSATCAGETATSNRRLRKGRGSTPCRHRASAYCRRCSRTHRKGHPRNEKPRWAEPTGADGGRNALAVGFGGESLMSPQPGSNRLLPLEPADGQTVLSADASRNDRQTQVTPVQSGLQGFHPVRPCGFSITEQQPIRPCRTACLKNER